MEYSVPIREMYLLLSYPPQGLFCLNRHIQAFYQAFDAMVHAMEYVSERIEINNKVNEKFFLLAFLLIPIKHNI